MTDGPKIDYVRDAQGEPVIGVQIQLEKDAQGRQYETYFAKADKGKRKRFGSSRDKPKAMHRFRIWQATEGKQPKPTIPVVMPNDDATFEALFPNAPNSDHLTPAVHADIGNAPDLIASDLEAIRRQERERLRAPISSDPKKAATELDCEPLALPADVDNLKPPQPSKRLTVLCDTYLEDKSLSPKEATNSRTWWDEFRAIT